MNYKKIYENLIDRAKNRILKEYSEAHHIIPKCLGGTDDFENIVRLTPEEHYVAHQLLVKLNPGHQGLAFAVIRMTTSPHGLRNTNKLYAWSRRALSRTMKGKPGIPSSKKGVPLSPETKAKLSASKKGRPAHNKGKRLSDETRAKMSASKIGKPLSEVAKLAQRARKRNPDGTFSRREF